MSLAVELMKELKASKPVKKKAETPAITLDEGMTIRVGGTECQQLPLGEVSRIFVECDAQIKELETRKRSLGDALKAAGVAALRMAEAEGKYFGKVIAGMATVTRQNKYKAINGGLREKLMEAVGVVEYSALFGEKAAIEFESVEALREFVAKCSANNIPVTGVISESVAPRSTFAETKCQLLRALPEESRTILESIGEDTTYAVSARKVGCDE